MTRNNCWLTVEANLAATWEAWLEWRAADPTVRGAEPPIDDWDRRALSKVADSDFTFHPFRQATIEQLAPKDQWRLMSVYDIKVPEWIDAGIARHGDALAGGDLGVGGLWWWEEGDPICALDDRYQWRPNQIVEFMPEECLSYDVENRCTGWAPATVVWDVILLQGQPPRELPQS